MGRTRCPLWVISRHCISRASCPLYPQKQTSELNRVMSALCQKRTFARLFDDLVRRGREIRRHLDAERLGGLEVDDQLKFVRLYHRQVSRLLPLENSPDVDASMGVGIAEVGAVAHQAARQRVFTLLVD